MRQATGAPELTLRRPGLPAARNPALQLAREPSGGRLLLGRFEIESELGRGAFGTVWRAHDLLLDRPVALKEIKLDDGGDEQARARVLNEARAMARLNHPAIVSLHEAALEQDAAYLVNELVPGLRLDKAADQGALSDRDVAEIGTQLCGALAHAHRQGVLHRDVKPSNVVLGDELPLTAKLTDFGVAALVEADRENEVVGTPTYMAPELLEGLPPSASADIYALGLVLYELWADDHPFRRPATAATTAAVCAREFQPLADLHAGLPPELCTTIDRCIGAAPEDRPSPAELKAVLTTHMPELDQTRWAPLDDESHRRLDLMRLGIGAFAAVATAVVGIVLSLPGTLPLACVAGLAGLVLGPGGLLGCGAVLSLYVAVAADRPGSAALLAVATAASTLGRIRFARAAWLGLGAFIWALALELATRETLIFNLPDTVAGFSQRQSDAVAAGESLVAALSSPLVIAAPFWMLLAWILPSFVQGRRGWDDIGPAGLWFGLAAGSHAALVVALADEMPARGTPGATALAAAITAVAVGCRYAGRVWGNGSTRDHDA